jgi:hypothetical protein
MNRKRRWSIRVSLHRWRCKLPGNPALINTKGLTVQLFLGVGAIALNSVAAIVNGCRFQASPTRPVPAAIVLFR